LSTANNKLSKQQQLSRCVRRSFILTLVLLHTRDVHVEVLRISSYLSPVSRLVTAIHKWHVGSARIKTTFTETD